MSEVVKLKTELKALKFQKMEIESETNKKLISIKDALAGSIIRSVGEIDFFLIYDLAKELRTLREKWDAIVADIKKIEKELE